MNETITQELIELYPNIIDVTIKGTYIYINGVEVKACCDTLDQSYLVIKKILERWN